MSYKQVVFTGLVLVLTAFTAALWFYPQLPNPMPSHWDAAGHVNGYLPRSWGAFVMPLTMLATWLLLSVLPRIAPRGYRLDTFLNIYGIVSLAVLALLLLLTVVVLFAAKGSNLPMQHIVPTAVGMLLVIIGNYLGKFRKNFFAGIRTPWTLANDEVWARTHRLGGWLFVIGGLTIILTGLAAPARIEPALLIATLAVIVLVPYGGSYFIYRRIERFSKNDQSD